MTTYIISFRIGSEGNYADRWASTVAAIRREAVDGATWEETTSFFLIRSHKDADTLAAAIYVGSDLSPTRDTLLVVNAVNGTYASRGEVKYPALLASFFPRGVRRGLLAS